MYFICKNKRHADTFQKRLKRCGILTTRGEGYKVEIFNVEGLKEPQRATEAARRIFSETCNIFDGCKGIKISRESLEAFKKTAEAWRNE